MPLVADIDGVRVESFNIDADEWGELKRHYRQMSVVMSCGRPGCPKTSSRGLHFFAHLPNTECGIHEGGPESAEHLRAKAIVAEAARAAGWTATVEYPGPDRSWIADVLVESLGRRIAIEVQWSSQKSETFLDRQERYEHAGLECFWLAGPKNTGFADKVPSYALSGTVDDLQLTIPNQVDKPEKIALGDAITSILGGEIVPQVEAVLTSIQIGSGMLKCWVPECQKWMTLWHVTGLGAETRCGQSFDIQTSQCYQPWQPARVEQAFQEIVRSKILSSKLPKPTLFDRRHSKIAKVYYIAQICPHCGVVQGDGKLRPNWTQAPYSIPITPMRFPFAPALCRASHHCRDIGRGRCGQLPITEPPSQAQENWWRGAPYNELLALPNKRAGA